MSYWFGKLKIVIWNWKIYRSLLLLTHASGNLQICFYSPLMILVCFRALLLTLSLQKRWMVKHQQQLRMWPIGLSACYTQRTLGLSHTHLLTNWWVVASNRKGAAPKSSLQLLWLLEVRWICLRHCIPFMLETISKLQQTVVASRPARMEL